MAIEKRGLVGKVTHNVWLVGDSPVHMLCMTDHSTASLPWHISLYCVYSEGGLEALLVSEF